MDYCRYLIKSIMIVIIIIMIIIKSLYVLELTVGLETNLASDSNRKKNKCALSYPNSKSNLSMSTFSISPSAL